MTTAIPEISVPMELKSVPGVNLPWYNYFKRLDSSAASSSSGLSNLGTASAEDIGTSGEKVPLLNAGNVFSKAQTFDPVELVSGASIPWDWSSGPIAKLLLEHDGTLAAPTNLNGKAGTWSLFIRQDSVGGRTLSFNGSYLFTGGNDPVLSTAANALDVITFVTDGTSIVGAMAKGFS